MRSYILFCIWLWWIAQARMPYTRTLESNRFISFAHRRSMNKLHFRVYACQCLGKIRIITLMFLSVLASDKIVAIFSQSCLFNGLTCLLKLLWKRETQNETGYHGAFSMSKSNWEATVCQISVSNTCGNFIYVRVLKWFDISSKEWPLFDVCLSMW